MASFKLLWKRSAEKELRKLPREAIVRLANLAESLVENPFPTGVRKLAGTEHTYRVRAGDYRLVYSVEEQRLVIEVVRVGHRKEVYR
jgi:mRNA interferase RelE/StbE